MTSINVYNLVPLVVKEEERSLTAHDVRGTTDSACLILCLLSMAAMAKGCRRLKCERNKVAERQ